MSEPKLTKSNKAGFDALLQLLRESHQIALKAETRFSELLPVHPDQLPALAANLATGKYNRLIVVDANRIVHLTGNPGDVPLWPTQSTWIVDELDKINETAGILSAFLAWDTVPEFAEAEETSGQAVSQ